MHDAQGQRKYLNASERLAFYQEANRVTNLRHRGLCLTLFFTGCRLSEALSLNATNIDSGEKTIVFRTLKKRGLTAHRAIPIPVHFLKFLESIAPAPAPLFGLSRTRGWEVVKRTMKDAGLDGIKASPKGLRHGYAIACIENNIPLTMVQKFLGHARLETTQIYLNTIGKEERRFASRLWPEKES